jgi:hypothetical protein
MKGYIYGIFNDENDVCYIGATTQKYPNTRFNQHKKQAHKIRYGDLFAYIEDPPYFKVLDEREYNNLIDLRKQENNFINCYKKHPKLKCCNMKCAYLAPEDYQEAHKKSKKKYELSNNGKYYKKWANYRYSRKKILLNELQQYIDSLDRRMDIKPSSIKGASHLIKTN